MKTKDLHYEFINYLQTHFVKRKELISLLSEVLSLERESVSRRLNGKVFFTVREVGLIAKELNISLDQLLEKPSESTSMSLTLAMPMDLYSIDDLIGEFKTNKDVLIEAGKNTMQMGNVFNSLPIEFFTPYKHLYKFMYFKWVYYFVKSQFYQNYSTWEVPSELGNYTAELMESWSTYKSIFYIWDNAVIWNLMKEISFFSKICILSNEDVLLIKEDLHHMLDDLERLSRENRSLDASNDNTVQLYVSCIPIGVSCFYFYSEDVSLIQYKTPFAYTTVYQDTKAFYSIYKWINSMKNLSTLISGSGAMERRVFFHEQHNIVDALVSN